MKKLVVLYYHEVVENGQGYSYQKIEKDIFEEQMRYLQKNGYQSLFFSELKESLPEKAVVVSFDDGFRSVYENAAPIMEKYGIRGNVYLPTAYIDNDPKFMTWEQAQKLHNAGTFQMQAHTHDHVDVRTLDADGLMKQLEGSDRLFAQKLGYRPEAFCLPFGTYDRKSAKKLRATGRYAYILGSYYGRISAGRYSGVLPRIGVSNDDTIETFIRKLEGRLDWKGPLQRARLVLQNLKKERVTHYDY